MRTTWTSRFKPGMKAPSFTTMLDDGSTLTSKDLAGKKWLFFFYNHDGSETCTKEACNIRDHFKELKKAGFQVYGISEDSVKKHQHFRTKYKLPYPLISDKDNELAKTFDIYGKKEFMGRVSDAVHRTTFVVDEKGIFLAVIHPVDSARHTQQIMTALAENNS